MADVKRKLCFVIGPIGDDNSEPRTHADWLLHGIIKPVFNSTFADFEVERADQIKAPGDINSQIINRLMDAELVIADMSLHNANAFYELAVRHMVGKPTIHMIEKGSKIPFDVAPHRAIYFSRKEYADLAHARDELVSVVREVLQPDFIVENPITHARARYELNKHATPEMKALASEVETMQATLATANERIEALTRVVTRFAPRPLATSQYVVTPTSQVGTPTSYTLAELGKLAVSNSAPSVSQLYTGPEIQSSTKKSE